VLLTEHMRSLVEAMVNQMKFPLKSVMVFGLCVETIFIELVLFIRLFD